MYDIEISEFEIFKINLDRSVLLYARMKLIPKF